MIQELTDDLDGKSSMKLKKNKTATQYQDIHRTKRESIPDLKKVKTEDTSRFASKESDKYWNTMQKLVDHKIQLKLLQRENEEERMECARDLQRKNMILLDLQIKAQKMQLESARNTEN